MTLGVVRVTTDAGAVTGAEMVTDVTDSRYERVVVFAKRGATILSTSFNTVADMISFSGNTITINTNYVVTALKNRDPIFDSILDQFALNGTYNYKIGVKHIASEHGNIAQIGTTNKHGTFVPSPHAGAVLDLGTGHTFNDLGTETTFFGGTFTLTDPVVSPVDPEPEPEPEPEPNPNPNPNPGDGDDDEEPTDPEEPLIDGSLLNELNRVRQNIDNALATGQVNDAIQSQAVNTSSRAVAQVRKIADAVQNGTNTSVTSILEALAIATRNLTSGTELAAHADATDSTQRSIMKNALDTVDAVADVIEQYRADGKSLTSNQQSYVSSIVDETLEILENAAKTDGATVEQLIDIVRRANNLRLTAPKIGANPTNDQISKIDDLSHKMVLAVMSKVVGEAVTENSLESVLNQHPELLDIVLQASLALAPSTSELDRDTQDKIKEAYRAWVAANSPSSTPEITTDTRFAGFPPGAFIAFGPNLDMEIPALVFGHVNQATLALHRLVASQVTTTEQGISVTQDPVTGYLYITLPGEAYSGVVTAIKAVPESVPSGMSFLRDGRVVFIKDGYALELAPVSVDAIAFLGATLSANYTPKFNIENGSFTLDLGGNQKFSGAYAYDNLTGKDLENCGVITFKDPVGELNSADYAFVATCSVSGVSQRILPFPYHDNFFRSVEGFGFSARLDRNTGFVTVDGVGRFKLGYFVDAPTSADISYLASNGDANGLAFAGGDFNGDGRLDFKVISASGVQLLLGTN